MPNFGKVNFNVFGPKKAERPEKAKIPNLGRHLKKGEQRAFHLPDTMQPSDLSQIRDIGWLMSKSVRSRGLPQVFRKIKWRTTINQTKTAAAAGNLLRGCGYPPPTRGAERGKPPSTMSSIGPEFPVNSVWSEWWKLWTAVVLWEPGIMRYKFLKNRLLCLKNRRGLTVNLLFVSIFLWEH